MNQQEKIIFDILNRFDPFSDGINFVDNVTDALLEAFPQIAKKPVKVHYLNEGEPGKESYGVFFDRCFDSLEQRQEWIDSHYVEVI